MSPARHFWLLPRTPQSPGIEFSWTRFWAKVLAEGVSDAKKEPDS
jgi:hypothetical protein